MTTYSFSNSYCYSVVFASKDNNSAYFIKLLQALNEIIQTKSLAQCLTHSKDSINSGLHNGDDDDNDQRGEVAICSLHSWLVGGWEIENECSVSSVLCLYIKI